MGLLDLIRSRGNKQNISEMVDKGAMIIDVRSTGEYAGGHIKGSKNIHLDQLQNRIGEVKAFDAPVITCCASGIRGGSAANVLRKHGVDVMNGGGWMSLSSRLGRLSDVVAVSWRGSRKRSFRLLGLYHSNNLVRPRLQKEG